MATRSSDRTVLGDDGLLAHLAREGAALGAAARPLDAPVPACPGWTIADLLDHVGRVHTWATRCVEAGPGDRIRLRDVPPAPPAAERPAWYRERHLALVAALRGSDPDRPVAGPGREGPRPARFWLRRQAHEAAVHRWDAQGAHGTPAPIEAAAAADGVDEVLREIVPALGDRIAGHGEVTHLAATDAGSGWWVRWKPGGVAVGPPTGRPDATVRATASDLLLLLWGRRRVADLDVRGDAAGLQRRLRVVSI